MDDTWTSERLTRPIVWIGGRALVLTLIVLLAISFDRGTVAGDGNDTLVRLSWPAPLGYLTALFLIYVTSCLYFAVRWRFDAGLAAWVLLLDLPILTAIVHWTGGIDSLFVMVYLPVALAASILRGPTVGTVVAGSAVAAYALVLFLESSGVVPPRGYGGDDGRVFTGSGIDVVRLSLQVLVIGVTGLLSGYLGRALNERSAALLTASRNLARARLDTSYVIEHLGSGLISLDEEGRILHFNRAAGRIMGVTPGEVLGRPFTEVLPAGAAPFMAWLQEARRGRASLFRREVEILNAEGRTVPLGMTGTNTADAIDPVDAEAEMPDGFIAVFQDLTHARLEEAARARQQRLAVIGGLAGGITHEIRNCVKPISGSLDLLLKELELDESNQRLMQLAVRECARLGSFVQAMLDYGRVSPLVIDEVRLDELIEECADLIRLSEGANRHQLVVDLRPAAVGQTVEVDREQIKQVLVNVAMNGLEAMDEESGTLIFCLDIDAGAEDTDDRGLVITVADTGPGIRSDEREHVFEPFFTTKKGGTGFGLAIASSIVERHGGSMSLCDAPRGALFRITLPGHYVLENPLVA